MPVSSGESFDSFISSYLSPDGTNTSEAFKLFLESAKDAEGEPFMDSLMLAKDLPIKKRNRRIKTLIKGLKTQAEDAGFNLANIMALYYDNSLNGDKFATETEANFFGVVNLWEPSIGGYQNAVVMFKDQVLNNPKNYIMASTPMDGTDFSKIGDTRKVDNPIESESPLYPIKQKDTNMTGRTGIGIFAVALKALSGLSMSIGNMISKADKAIKTGKSPSQLFKWIANKITFNGIDYTLIGNTNIELVNNPELIAKGIIAARKDGKIEDVSDIDAALFLIRERLKFDSYDAESQLVTASTDNAKMLLMPKINANADTCKIYAVMTALNIPPEQQVQFMGSELVNILIKNTKGNIFKGIKQETFDNIVKFSLGAINRVEPGKKLDVLVPILRKSTNEIKKYNEADLEAKLEQIQYIIDLANEFSIIGTIFSINNGIKPTPYDMYSYEMKVNRFFKERNFTFDFKGFVMDLYLAKKGDEQANQRVIDKIEEYDSIKSGFNVLAAIQNNDHYISQLATHFVGKDLINLNMASERATTALIQNMQDTYLLSSTKKIQRDQYRNVGRYIADSIAAQYINNNPQYFTVHYAVNQKLTDDSGIFINAEAKDVTLDDPKARQQFMAWFFNVVKPYLSETLGNYSIIQDLQDNNIKDRLLNSQIDYVDLVFDTTNASNRNLQTVFATYMSDFEQIKDIDVFGNKLGHLLFMYNFILTRQAPKKGSFSRIMTALYPIGKNESNPLSDWFKYLEGMRTAKTEASGYNVTIGDVELNPLEMFANYPMDGIQRVKEDLEEDADYPEPGDPSDDDLAMAEEYNPEDGENVSEPKAYKAKYTQTAKGVASVSLVANNQQTIFIGSPEVPNIYLPVKGKSVAQEIQPSIHSEVSDKSKTKSGNLKALYEMINKLKELNPEIQVNILNSQETSGLVGPKFKNVAAFVKNGQVYINEDIATSGDVLHEFGHIALESIKSTDQNLYNEIIQAAMSSDRFGEIQSTYAHLTSDEDVAVEVFMNILGDSYNAGKIKTKEKSWFKQFNNTIIKFLNFVKSTVERLIGNKVDMPAAQFVGENLEVLINNFGNDILKKKIRLEPTKNLNLEDIKAKLFSSNLINLKCNG